MQDLATPIVCPDGQHIVNRWTNKNPLKCMDRQGVARENAHFVPMLIGGSLVYYPLLILSLFSAMRKEREGAAPVRRPSTPYR